MRRFFEQGRKSHIAPIRLSSGLLYQRCLQRRRLGLVAGGGRVRPREWSYPPAHLIIRPCRQRLRGKHGAARTCAKADDSTGGGDERGTRGAGVAGAAIELDGAAAGGGEPFQGSDRMVRTRSCPDRDDDMIFGLGVWCSAYGSFRPFRGDVILGHGVLSVGRER